MAKVKKVSDNPRYYSTGRKLDVKTKLSQYKPAGWMPYHEYQAMKKQEAAIRAGIKPSPELLAILHTLEAETDNQVVQQISVWYGLHGVMRLSQVAYLNKVWETRMA